MQRLACLPPAASKTHTTTPAQSWPLSICPAPRAPPASRKTAAPTTPPANILPIRGCGSVRLGRNGSLSTTISPICPSVISFDTPGDASSLNAVFANPSGCITAWRLSVATPDAARIPEITPSMLARSSKFFLLSFILFDCLPSYLISDIPIFGERVPTAAILSAVEFPPRMKNRSPDLAAPRQSPSVALSF